MPPSPPVRRSPRLNSTTSTSTTSTTSKTTSTMPNPTSSRAPKALPSKPTKKPTIDPNEDPTYPYFLFYGHAPSNPIGCLSQWHLTSFTEHGITFATAEHYMMYHKAQLFEPEGSDVPQAVLDAPGPREAKALGRSVVSFDVDIWNARADAIVEQANYLKFTQNADAWDVLKATRGHGPPKALVEAAPRDRIWGIGFAPTNARGKEAKWGDNRLGKALTRVRERILEEQEA